MYIYIYIYKNSKSLRQWNYKNGNTQKKNLDMIG